MAQGDIRKFRKEIDDFNTFNNKRKNKNDKRKQIDRAKQHDLKRDQFNFELPYSSQ